MDFPRYRTLFDRYNSSFYDSYLAVDDTKVCLRPASQHDKDQVWTLPHTSGPNANTIVCMSRGLLCVPSKGFTTAFAEVDLRPRRPRNAKDFHRLPASCAAAQLELGCCLLEGQGAEGDSPQAVEFSRVVNMRNRSVKEYALQVNLVSHIYFQALAVGMHGCWRELRI